MSRITVLGLVLLVAAVYGLAGPGRIDIIDGQYRFEVAKNILEDGSIQLDDPFLPLAAAGISGVYSPYGVSGSLVALPLVWFANHTGPATADRRQFFFSFTSAVLGAITAGALLLLFSAIGVQRRPAVGWTLVAAFATLTFPVATTVFDQAQHGCFVLIAVACAFMSARRDSTPAAVASGAALAVLINFQETYVILLPTVAIAALAMPGAAPEARRRGFERACVVVVVGAMGVLLWAGINSFRFGSLLHSGKQTALHPSALGNPLYGIPGLLISPDKSIFLYSPPTILALFGLRRLLRLQPRLAQAAIASTAVYFAMISCLSFYGGDWCWGPRYFAAILPLVAIGFPFAALTTRARRAAAAALIVAGVAVQSMALTVDAHRFFFAHSLPSFFWYRDHTFYFTHSALLERPREIAESLRGVPPEADTFRPGPYSAELTYAPFGGWGHPGLSQPQWMRHYQVFWLWRPWPLWMHATAPDRRPVNLPTAVGSLGTVGAVGFVMVALGLRRRRDETAV